MLKHEDIEHLVQSIISSVTSSGSSPVVNENEQLK